MHIVLEKRLNIFCENELDKEKRRTFVRSLSPLPSKCDGWYGILVYIRSSHRWRAEGGKTFAALFLIHDLGTRRKKSLHSLSSLACLPGLGCFQINIFFLDPAHSSKRAGPLLNFLPGEGRV